MALAGLEELFKSWEILHTVVVGLKLRVALEYLTFSELDGEVGVLEQDEIGHADLITCEERIVTQKRVDLLEVIEARLGNHGLIVLHEALHEHFDDIIVAD